MGWAQVRKVSEVLFKPPRKKKRKTARKTKRRCKMFFFFFGPHRNPWGAARALFQKHFVTKYRPIYSFSFYSTEPKSILAIPDGFFPFFLCVCGAEGEIKEMTSLWAIIPRSSRRQVVSQFFKWTCDSSRKKNQFECGGTMWLPVPFSSFLSYDFFITFGKRKRKEKDVFRTI